MLNALAQHIPAGERVITIEDNAELQIRGIENLVRLEARNANVEGTGEISIRDLIKSALRMRPDRIVVGEVRGSEAIDMLQAMNTGHEGSMATIHANTPRDAITRMENMVGMAGMNLPPKVIRQQISSALSVVIQVARLTDGKRKVTSIQEITGTEGDVITMQEIFQFVQTGIGVDGTVQGYFCATGVRPKFIERLKTHGVEISDALFDPSKRFE